jgi:hypothetical protein
VSRVRPTTACLQRYTIDVEQISNQYDLWILDLPFQTAFEEYANTVKQLLGNRIQGEYVGIPYRLLNNSLMTLCPTLTHGFEKSNERRLALAVGVPDLPAQLPNPQHIRRIIRAWAYQWAEQAYITKNIETELRQSLLRDLDDAILNLAKEWRWQRLAPSDLLVEATNNPINYRAVPSILASLLHDKRSSIYENELIWRKVQGEDGKLAIISQPLWASYTEIKQGVDLTKYGWFAYKLVFELETQAGRGFPWVFISLHAQRYGDTRLTRTNAGRNVSVLVGANKSRLDDLPFDSTLVRLSFDFDKKLWQDNLPGLLNRIGVMQERQLVPPEVLIGSADPREYWKLQHDRLLEDENFENEYYVVHAEGYKYGDYRAGHGLHPGYSQTERDTVIASILQHLPMLQPDGFLLVDSILSPSGLSKPRAMREYGEMKTLKRPSKMSDVIERALRGEIMYIAVLYNDTLTRDGIISALRKALFLGENEDFPPNLKVQPHFVSDELHEKFQIPDGGRYIDEHRDKVHIWSEYLQEILPSDAEGYNFFAIVERITDNDHGWGIYAVIRHACAQNHISSQMIKSLAYINKKGERKESVDQEHRLDNAAREIVLRQIGGLYGHPHEVYQVAGIDHPLEVLAFHLHRDQSGVTYPIAVKIAEDGAVEACFPKTDPIDYMWELYPNAATSLGRLVAEQWNFSQWDNDTKQRKLVERSGKRSILAMQRNALTRFVINVLLELKTPTIAVIAAKNWRNYDVWPQLRNPDLSMQHEVLNFNNVPGTRIEEVIPRDDPRIQNLVAMVRVRADDETPQYLTDTLWEFKQSAGFIDLPSEDMMHYFSIGKELKTAKKQSGPKTRYAPMTNGGAGISYRMSQIVEFVPFFVRSDYATLDGKKRLCRVLHYLRVSPAWEMGNIIYPYPLHLAVQMVKDQLSILGNDE